MKYGGVVQGLGLWVFLITIAITVAWVGQEAGIIDKPEPPSCGVSWQESDQNGAWVVTQDGTCYDQHRYERMVVAALNDTERGLTVGELEDVTGLEYGLLRGPLNEVVNGLRESGIVRMYDPCDPGLLGGTNCETRILLNEKNYRNEVAP